MFLSGDLVAELESQVTKARTTLEPRFMPYRPGVAELLVDKPTAGRSNVNSLLIFVIPSGLIYKCLNCILYLYIL